MAAIRHLAADAVDPGGLSGRRDVLLRRSYDGDVWRFAYSDRGPLVCWVLIVPRPSDEGTCGTHEQLKARSVLVYAISREGRGGVTVVYGWVSDRVRRLRLRLADCSTLRVPLATRPIFWSFIPMTRPTVRTVIYPTAFTADLADGEAVYRRFAPIGGPSDARCSGRRDELSGRG